MSFPKYEKYKDSRVEWLGKVPEAWTVYRSKVVFAERNIKASEEDEQLTASQKYGVIPQKRFSELEDHQVMQVILGRSILKKAEVNDFVISMRSFQGGLEFCPYSGAISSAYVPLYAKREIDNSFFKYLFKSEPFITALQQTSNLVRDGQALRYSNFTQLSLPLPSITEQRSIGALLDHETARIDALIAEQERLIALLKEKRQAVISHAVTKGCDRTVPMKDSGVEWIGEVPEHWTYGLKLLNLALEEQHSFVNGPFGSDLLASEITEEGVPVIYSGDVKAGSFLRKSSKYVTPEKAKQLNFCRVDPGDLLLAKVGDPPGEAAIYPKNSVVGIVTQDVVRVKVDQKKAAASYVRYLLNSDAGRYAIKLISVESTRNRFSLGDFKAIRVCIPTFSDQIKIVQFLDNETAHIDALVEQANKGVRLLQERRSALISAAVTGKIDVRNWQPPTSKASIPMLEAVHR